MASSTRPLRIWPGIVIVALQWVLRFGLGEVWPEQVLTALLAGMGGALLVVLWWVGLSRAPWRERVSAVVVLAALSALTWRLIDVSIATGAQRLLLALLAAPTVSLAWVGWAWAARNVTGPARFATMAAALAAGLLPWTLVRTEGFDGSFRNDLRWRWSQTAEQRLVERSKDEALAPVPSPPPEPVAAAPAATVEKKTAPAAAPVGVAPAEWPGFRGPGRDGAVRGVRIEEDWTRHPPVEMWRREVGPGWSSIAVAGDLIYTQEQRGEEEVVACYQRATGKPVWLHRDRTRFWESNAGAGPRATPEVAGGRVYTLGATGIVNALNARDGSVVWSRNAVEDTGAKVPTWGISGSPLVVGDTVFVAASGTLAAYETSTGKLRWKGPAGPAGYCTPQWLKLGGAEQVVLVNGTGAAAFAPTDGTLLWQHEWKGYPMVQAGITGEGDLLLTSGQSSGVRRITLAGGPGQWKPEERWTTNGLKPYYSDYVVHKGHAYGFDGAILAAIGLDDGKRKWKGGRYGQGQMLLLAAQDLLVVLGEEGELALVRAAPDGFTEVARREGIEGKTWNHPVLVGDTLLVRNGEQMAAFRLTLADKGQ